MNCCDEARRIVALAEQPVPVHEMTPEMMRKVQIQSELGAYAAANLSNAYELFAEFWRVAMSAAPQPAQPTQPEQTPVAWRWKNKLGEVVTAWLEYKPNEAECVREQVTNENGTIEYAYADPPQRQQRTWVGLSEEEVADCIKFPGRNLFARDGTTSQRIARAIEAKLKEKNT